MKLRRAALFVVASLAVAACASNDEAARTKNLTIGKISPTTESRPIDRAPAEGDQCSPLGAVYRSNPIIVPPPEPNSTDQSYSSSDSCSFANQYRNFPGIGRYEFVWDATTTPKSVSGRSVVIEVSRDGVLWTALATDWSPTKPHSAVAYLTMSGNLRVRVRLS